MIVRNYLVAEMSSGTSHKGNGLVNNAKLFGKDDFETGLQFMYYTEIPPGASIGYHRHKEDEEVYVILEGNGLMNVNGDIREVKQGDVIVNKPFWSHGLENNSDGILKIFVFEVAKV